MKRTLEARLQALEEQQPAPTQRGLKQWVWVAFMRHMGETRGDRFFWSESKYRDALTTMSPEHRQQCEEHLRELHERHKGETVADVQFCYELLGDKTKVDACALTKNELQHFTERLDRLRDQGDLFVEFPSRGGTPGSKLTYRQMAGHAEAHYWEQVRKCLREDLELLRLVYG